MTLNGTTYAQGTATPDAGKNKNNITLPVGAQLTVNLPRSGQLTPTASGSGDAFIYGATLSSQSFAVAGLSTSELADDTNIVYGSMTRDALAALNFGFMNSKLGNDGSLWYSSIPTDAPFGAARSPDDGFYNPWAALVYNNSDAYGFAFSDRTHPSPLIKLGVGPDVPAGAVETLRITILPDSWLDAPKIKVNTTTNALTWDAVPLPSGYTLTGYTLNFLDPPGIAPVTIAAGQTSYSLASLAPGVQYSVALALVGTRDTKPITSTSSAIQFVTAGTAPVNAGTHPFQVTLSYDPPGGLLGPFTATAGGEALDYKPATRQWQQGAVNATLHGNTGVNIYPVTISNSIDGVIFDTNLAVTFDSGGNVTTSGCFGGSVNKAGAGAGTILTLLLNDYVPLKIFSPVLSAITNYADWKGPYPGLLGSAPTDDTDGDRISNLLEYFHGSHPEEQSIELSPVAGSSIGSVVMSYGRSKTIQDVTEVVKWSTDLVTWHSDGVAFDIDEDMGGYVQRTARVSLAGDTKLFMRLEVTYEP